MDPAQFLQGRTRETEIRRDASGRWFNGEDRIEHPKLARSFDGWVDRAEDGRFCLSNSINWAYVEIDGPAYFVKDVEASDDEIRLLLSGDWSEALDPRSLRQANDGVWHRPSGACHGPQEKKQAVSTVGVNACFPFTPSVFEMRFSPDY